MTPIKLPYHQHTDYTLPRVGGELGGTDVVKIQNSPNGGVNWEPKTGRENSFVKSYFARASR